MADDISAYQLETVTCYMAVCFRCQKATAVYETENLALAHAEAEGYKSVGGSVSCQACIPEAVAAVEEYEAWSRQYRATSRRRQRNEPTQT